MHPKSHKRCIIAPIDKLKDWFRLNYDVLFETKMSMAEANTKKPHKLHKNTLKSISRSWKGIQRHDTKPHVHFCDLKIRDQDQDLLPLNHIHILHLYNGEKDDMYVGRWGQTANSEIVTDNRTQQRKLRQKNKRKYSVHRKTGTLLKVSLSFIGDKDKYKLLISK